MLSMERADAHPLPARDPVTGGDLVITELEGPESGITIRGRFEMPRFARLSPDQARYLETFLRCRGMLNSVEKELGISYPTARARLDAVLRALDLHAVRDAPTGSASEEPPVEAPPFDAGWDEPAGEPDAFDTPEAEEPTIQAAEPSAPEVEKPKRTRMEVLEALSRGELTADEAKRELGVAQ